MDLAFMVIMDLFFIVDELSSLFGVTGDIGEGNGEFNFQVEFNGCWKDEVIAEDFLFFIWVFGVTANTDPGIGIFR